MTQEKSQTILELGSLTVNYGLMQALSEINLHIDKGEIVAILGPNAAGKTTLMYAITGIVPITKGKITFNGQNIINLGPEQIVRLGISLVPEGRLLFPGMKTIENLELGAYHYKGRNRKENMKIGLDEVFELFPILKDRRNQMAGTLSGGQQQMLALGRGLMSKPELLLLDEPSLGLAPLLVKEVMNTLMKLKERGLTILFSEQNALAALSIADRGYVVNAGKVVMEGDSQQLRSMDKIRIAYLGK